jgi:DNA-binding LacI/PurR family transcriptional regulator
MEPNITTVYQDTKLLGIKSAELLLKRINGEEITDINKQVVIETRLLKGQTVKALT